MRRATMLPGVVVLSVVMVLSACGGDSGASREEFAEGTCAAFDRFAAQVLPALTEGDAAKVFTGQFEPKNLEEVTAAFESVGVVFGRFEAALGALVDKIDELEAPDGKSGAAFQERLVGALGKAKVLMASAGTRLADADLSSVDDIAALGPAMEEFGTAFKDINLDFESEAPEELQAAFKASETCQKADARLGDL